MSDQEHDTTSTEPPPDKSEVHDDLIPEDLPPDHPGREEAERLAEAEGGTTQGNQ